MEKTVVQKYGGSSLATEAKVLAVAAKILAARKAGYSPVAVVSAQGDETDELLARARSISPRPAARELDALLAVGEQKSSALLAIALCKLGLQALSLTGGQAGIHTKGAYGDSRILAIETEKLRGYLLQGYLPVVAGFQGVNAQGETTTLGRGGTDITAVAIAAALGCPCEIYTDVDGIYRADPSLVPAAKKLTAISWDDLSEMSALGARVLNERAVELAKKYAVPIYIGGAHSSEKGTYVLEVTKVEEDKITAVLVDDDILRINIGDVPPDPWSQQQLFELLSEKGVGMGMVQREWTAEGRMRISFTCAGNCRQIVECLESQLPYPVAIIRDEARISLLGSGVLNQARVTSCIMQNLASLDVGLRHLITSERSLSLFIGKGDRERVAARLAQTFDLCERSVAPYGR